MTDKPRWALSYPDPPPDLIPAPHGHALFGCDYCALSLPVHAINCPRYWATRRCWTKKAKAKRERARRILEAHFA